MAFPPGLVAAASELGIAKLWDEPPKGIEGRPTRVGIVRTVQHRDGASNRAKARRFEPGTLSGLDVVPGLSVPAVVGGERGRIVIGEEIEGLSGLGERSDLAEDAVFRFGVFGGIHRSLETGDGFEPDGTETFPHRVLVARSRSEVVAAAADQHQTADALGVFLEQR